MARILLLYQHNGSRTVHNAMGVAVFQNQKKISGGSHENAHETYFWNIHQHIAIVRL